MRVTPRRLTAFGILVLVASIVYAAGIARPICMEYTGWVTDSECGAKGATVSHTKEHVEQVLGRGGQLLFFSEADHKLYPIADPVAAMDHVGERIMVDAHVELVIHSYAASPESVAH